MAEDIDEQYPVALGKNLKSPPEHYSLGKDSDAKDQNVLLGHPDPPNIDRFPLLLGRLFFKRKNLHK